MTDKKFTEEETVKALEVHSDTEESCMGVCPYSGDRRCGSKMAHDALVIINRQKAEIETARAEAIEEFAERLKETMTTQTTDNINEPCVNIIYYADETIDEIAKELTEDADNEQRKAD